MKNILVTLFTLFCITSCCKQICKTSDIILGSTLQNVLVIENGKLYQIDSIIKADTLREIEKWYYSSFQDYQTKEQIEKKMTIKNYGKTSITYIITGNKEPFKIEKRIKK